MKRQYANLDDDTLMPFPYRNACCLHAPSYHQQLPTTNDPDDRDYRRVFINLFFSSSVHSALPLRLYQYIVVNFVTFQFVQSL